MEPYFGKIDALTEMQNLGIKYDIERKGEILDLSVGFRPHEIDGKREISDALCGNTDIYIAPTNKSRGYIIKPNFHLINSINLNHSERFAYIMTNIHPSGKVKSRDYIIFEAFDSFREFLEGNKEIILQ